MNILLTGARGFVGSRIAQAVGCKASPSLRGAKEDQVRAIVESFAPDAIIHTAAIADMDACQRDPEASYHANVRLPLYLAKAAPKAKLLCFSTDQVYNGNQNEGPYRETEALQPANVYAQHKLEMEKRVLDVKPDAVMLRATWMYDLPQYQADNRNNFMMHILLSALARRPVHFSKTEYRGITYVREVARQTVQALGLPGGVYNFGSENRYSIFDTAKALYGLLGIPGEPQESQSNRNLWMDITSIRNHGLDFQDTVPGFATCLADYGLSAKQ